MRENTLTLAGTRYRSVPIDGDKTCQGCVAWPQHDSQARQILCESLPACNKHQRKDRRHVIWIKVEQSQCQQPRG